MQFAPVPSNLPVTISSRTVISRAGVPARSKSMRNGICSTTRMLRMASAMARSPAPKNTSTRTATARAGCRRNTDRSSRDIGKAALTPAAFSARAFDPFHVGIAEPEMVADLVDQHVADDRVQVLTGLAPIVEDRPAVEKDHVELRPRVADAAPRQRGAAEIGRASC